MTRKIECIGLSLFCSMALSAVVSPLNAETLTWNGGENGVWKKDGAGWKNAANEACQWQDGSEAILTGARVIVAEEGVKAATILFKGNKSTITGGRVTMTGEEPRIESRVGVTADIQTPISMEGTSNLKIFFGADLSFNDYLFMNDQLILPGCTLSQIDSFEAIAGGTGSDTGYRPGTKYVPCFDTQDENGRSIQFQYETSDAIYCLKVQFSDRYGDIYAKVLYCKWIYRPSWNWPHIGKVNFDSVTTNIDFATSESALGYGISCVNAYLKGENEEGKEKGAISLTGGIDIFGNIMIENGRILIGGDYGINGGFYENSIDVQGDLVLDFGRGQIFKGNITGGGSCEVLGSDSSVSVVHPGALTGEFAVVAENARLAQLRGIAGKVLGGAIGPKGAPYSPCFFRNDGTTTICQMQICDNIYTKCVIVELKQEGNDILGRISAVKFNEDPNNDVVGFDFSEKGTLGTIVTTDDAIGYGLEDLTLFFSSGVSFFGSCSVMGGIVISGPVTVQTFKSTSLPSSGNIVVQDNASLLVSDPSMTMVGDYNPIIVKDGGRAIFEYSHTIQTYAAAPRKVIVDGGSLELRAYHDSYINDIEMLNGARFEGRWIQVGHVADTILKVGGKSPSYLTRGVCLVEGWPKGQFAFKPVVEDVTGDPEPDLYIQHLIRDFSDSNLVGLPIEKSGAGTVSITATNTAIGEVRISEGAIRFDSPYAVTEVNNIKLQGGGIEVGTVSNNAGTLTVTTTNSILDMTEGGTLAFKNSSECVWGNDAVLTIKGDLGRDRLRFGTDVNGLTADQLSKIKAGDYPVYISDDGYLRNISKGTVLIIK